MSLPFESIASQANIEAAVAAIRDLGQLPMIAAGFVIPTMNALDRAPAGLKSKFFRGALVLGFFLLASCEASHPIDSRLQTELMLSNARQTEIAQEAQQPSAEPWFTPTETAENPYQPREFNSDWTRYAQVEAGDEGVIGALLRAHGVTPHEHTNVPEGYQQVVEILHKEGTADTADDWLEVWSWGNLVDPNIPDPVVDAGDQILDTFKSVLRQVYPLLPENDHTH